MITIKTTFETKKFNLKNFEREKALHDAWHAMQGDESFDKKTFKIVTTEGEILEYKISEMLDCKYDLIDREDTVHCEGHCDGKCTK